MIAKEVNMDLLAGTLGLRTLRAVVAEFIATALFLFVGAGTVVSVTRLAGEQPIPIQFPGVILTIGVAFGLTIALLVAATGRISGGHINPAITFAAVLTGRTNPVVGLLYVAAQIAGAVVGVALLKAVLADNVEGNLGVQSINLAAVASVQMGFLVEIILTFVLVFVVFATAIDPKGPHSIAPIAIGLAVLVDHLIGVPLTGASMNPARSFGPAAITNMWHDHWVYWAGPLIGGGTAGILYFFLFMFGRPEEEKSSEP